MRILASLALCLVPALAAPAAGTLVYRCVDASGHLAFQQNPCPRGSRQTILNMPPPPPAVPAPSLPAAHVTPSPSPRPAKQVQPLPALYRCINATNGRRYISSIGNPQPYLAPLGILGVPQLPLAQAYGPGGIGVSAPGVGQPPHVASPIAGFYSWVQDRCTPLPRSDVCEHLRKSLDALESRISQTFQFDRPPLEREAKTLRARLQSCP